MTISLKLISSYLHALLYSISVHHDIQGKTGHISFYKRKEKSISLSSMIWWTWKLNLKKLWKDYGQDNKYLFSHV